MTGLDLDPRLRAALGHKVSQLLRASVAPAHRFNWILLPDLDVDASLPAHGETRDRIAHYVGDRPLRSFVSGVVNDRLSLLAPRHTEQPLPAIPGFEDIDAISAEIVESFNRLPRRYIYSSAAPGIFKRIVGPDQEIRFGKAIAIRGGGPHLTDRLPLSSGSEARDRHLFRRTFSPMPEELWKGCYLQTEDDGYSNPEHASSLDRRAGDSIRTFHGLCIAHGLIGERLSGWFPFAGPVKARVHCRRDAEWEIVEHLTLDEPTGRMMVYYGVDDVHDDKQPEVLRDLVLSADIGGSIARAYLPVGGTERVRLAAMWLCDCYANDNVVMAFLQAMVVLEILLGDKAASDKIGLNELLRNRCAYLIGTSSSDRDEILTRFSEIYDVRSRIVHRGESTIALRDQQRFDLLKDYCRRAIRAELKLVAPAQSLAIGSITI